MRAWIRDIGWLLALSLAGIAAGLTFNLLDAWERADREIPDSNEGSA